MKEDRSVLANFQKSEFLLFLAILFVKLIGQWKVIGFVPIAGLSTIIGARYPKNNKYLVFIAAMLCGDIILGLINPYHIGFFNMLAFQPFIYITILLMLLCSTLFKNQILFLSFLNPFLFFFVSNLFVWLNPIPIYPDLYPKTLQGLTNCYIAAIPFALKPLVVDFILALFGVLIIDFVTSTFRLKATNHE